MERFHPIPPHPRKTNSHPFPCHALPSPPPARSVPSVIPTGVPRSPPSSHRCGPHDLLGIPTRAPRPPSSRPERPAPPPSSRPERCAAPRSGGIFLPSPRRSVLRTAHDHPGDPSTRSLRSLRRDDGRGCHPNRRASRALSVILASPPRPPPSSRPERPVHPSRHPDRSGPKGREAEGSLHQRRKVQDRPAGPPARPERQGRIIPMAGPEGTPFCETPRPVVERRRSLRRRSSLSGVRSLWCRGPVRRRAPGKNVSRRSA